MDRTTCWEYHVIRAELDHEGYARVVWVDDRQEAEATSTDPMRLMTLYELLAAWGAQGWDLVGFSPIQGSSYMQYIVKRPVGG